MPTFVVAWSTSSGNGNQGHAKTLAQVVLWSEATGVPKPIMIRITFQRSSNKPVPPLDLRLDLTAVRVEGLTTLLDFFEASDQNPGFGASESVPESIRAATSLDSCLPICLPLRADSVQPSSPGRGSTLYVPVLRGRGLEQWCRTQSLTF